MKVAVIGYGKQGQRLALKFHELGVLYGICDTDQKAYKDAHYRKAWDAEAVLKDSNVDAVVISTPTPTHYEIAREALKAGKDVLVEKPLTNNSKQARELVELATTGGRILMVGHVTLYLPAVERLGGKITKYRSIRTSTGRLGTGEGVIWRLLSHDVATAIYLFNSTPEVLHAGARERDGIAVSASAMLGFGGSGVANMYASWEYEEKIRSMTMTLESGEEMSLEETGDPLKTECEHFLHCIETREKPLTDGEFGLRVVRVLEEIERKL